jgi:hypothetical protein
MLYAAQYWRPTKSDYNALNQIIAIPLRRALGLHRSSSAARTLWEFGIPDFETLRKKCLLQGINRAARSANNGNFLPSILIDDIKNQQPYSSSHYCRPVSIEFAALKVTFPDNVDSKIPISDKALKGIITASMTSNFVRAARHTPKWLRIKPSPQVASYLSVDTKPLVCIRARLRLSCALTPHRKHIYRLTDTSLCCGELGDADHVIMRCSKFTAARVRCINDLHTLYVPVDLSTDLAAGLPPPPPSDPSLHAEKTFLRMHHQACLAITGDFLLAIDKIIHL